jgi:uncharacterized protein
VKAERWVLAVAMLLPTAAALLYFVGLSGNATDATKPSLLFQIAYYGSKTIQFLLPVAWLAVADRAALRRPNVSLRGVPIGLAFGVATATLIFGLYYGQLAESPAFVDVAARVRAKVSAFGMATPARYLLRAAFLCIVHSLLEEYYWRWFVYGRLRLHIRRGVAQVISGFAFMAHHVVIIWVYFPGQFWSAVLPFSLGVAVGGVVWARLYERSGSLLGPWLSHLLVDVALMVVGYELVFRRVGRPS